MRSVAIEGKSETAGSVAIERKHQNVRAITIEGKLQNVRALFLKGKIQNIISVATKRKIRTAKNSNRKDTSDCQSHSCRGEKSKFTAEMSVGVMLSNA